MQVVLKLFASAADVLSSFDVDCCAFCYDGAAVRCTHRAMRAAATKVNLVDVDRRSKTYESRLLKYGRRGFAIGLGADLFDPSRVDPGLFDATTLLGAEGLPKSGLARLLVSDKLGERKRSVQLPRLFQLSALAAGPPLQLADAWAAGWLGHWRARDTIVPLSTTSRYFRGNVEMSGNEMYNVNEADEASGEAATGNEATGMRPVLYSPGVVPWRVGYDCLRIEAALQGARHKGDNWCDFLHSQDGRGMSESELRGYPAEGARFALTAQRSLSVLPSEHVSDWGYKLGCLLTPSSFSLAERNASFSPVPAAGFSSSCHLPPSAASHNLAVLVLAAPPIKLPPPTPVRSAPDFFRASRELPLPAADYTAIEAASEPPPRMSEAECEAAFAALGEEEREVFIKMESKDVRRHKREKSGDKPGPSRHSPRLRLGEVVEVKVKTGPYCQMGHPDLDAVWQRGKIVRVKTFARPPKPERGYHRPAPASKLLVDLRDTTPGACADIAAVKKGGESEVGDGDDDGGGTTEAGEAESAAAEEAEVAGSDAVSVASTADYGGTSPDAPFVSRYEFADSAGALATEIAAGHLIEVEAHDWLVRRPFAPYATLRKLSEAGLVPTGERPGFDGMSYNKLTTMLPLLHKRGLVLRGALTPSEAATAREINESVRNDPVLRVYSGDAACIELSFDAGATCEEQGIAGFLFGDLVVIVGLAKQPQFNGRRGTVIGGFEPEGGRYPVEVELLAGEVKRMKIKMNNLRFRSREEDEGGADAGGDDMLAGTPSVPPAGGNASAGGGGGGAAAAVPAGGPAAPGGAATAGSAATAGGATIHAVAFPGSGAVVGGEFGPAVMQQLLQQMPGPNAFVPPPGLAEAVSQRMTQRMAGHQGQLSAETVVTQMAAVLEEMRILPPPDGT